MVFALSPFIQSLLQAKLNSSTYIIFLLSRGFNSLLSGVLQLS